MSNFPEKSVTKIYGLTSLALHRGLRRCKISRKKRYVQVQHYLRYEGFVSVEVFPEKSDNMKMYGSTSLALHRVCMGVNFPIVVVCYIYVGYSFTD